MQATVKMPDSIASEEENGVSETKAGPGSRNPWQFIICSTMFDER